MAYKKYYRDILITAGLTALTGELYFYPFGTGFRFTAGVITISFLMLYFSKIPELLLIPISGIAVVAFRVFLGYFVNHMSFIQAFHLHYPAFFFYLSYAIFLKMGKIKELLKAPINFIVVMSLADVGANFVELTVRNEMSLGLFQDIFNSTLGVGLIRGIITFALYWLIERYKLVVLREEDQKRYAELLALLSELKSELFYIKKSTKDIEDAMKSSFEIYRSLEPGVSEERLVVLKRNALTLARDIHEIKKDYLRIVVGVGQLLPEEKQEGISLSALISIIRANTERLIGTLGKNTELIMHLDEDIIVINYFSLFSIVNNLVSNAIEAVNSSDGLIKVNIYIQDKSVKIIVMDNGKGIDSKDLPYIFEPGFSTKLTEDGSFSTGLGLTHVKNLVEDMGGQIYVFSDGKTGTKFKLDLPILGNFLKSNV